MLDEIGRDLGTGISNPDHENPFARELATGGVLLRMDDSSLEIFHPRPTRQSGHVVAPCRDDDRACGPTLLSRLHDPSRAFLTDPFDALPEADAEPHAFRILSEISRVHILGDVPRVRARHRIERQPGEATDCVQMEPLVALRPGCSDSLAGIDHHRLAPAPLQRGRHREPGRPGTNHDHVSPRHCTCPR